MGLSATHFLELEHAHFPECFFYFVTYNTILMTLFTKIGEVQ